VAEVLPEDKILFLDSSRVIDVWLDVVNALLKLLIFFLFKGVDVENEEVPVVASYPGEVVMDTAAEKSMARSLLHSDGLQSLGIIYM